jgi:hypothetical protein
MTNTHVISALRLKRAEISGHIHDLEKRIARQRANLANLDAPIKLFSPGENPDAIPPKRVYRRTRYFAHNELSRLTQDALRIISTTYVGRNSRRRHAGKGNAFRRYGVQGDRRSAGAYRVAASREARDRGKARHKPRRQMDARGECLSLKFVFFGSRLNSLAPSINYSSCRDVVQLYSVRH